MESDRSCNGNSDHALYDTWSGMLSRCNNPKHPRFGRYGGRGIKVCMRWLSFDNFLNDMGCRPDGFTLDRINNDGNYEPSNCRWASRAQQNENRNFNRNLIDGKMYSFSDLAKKYSVSSSTIRDRLSRGMSLKEACEAPIKIGGYRGGGRKMNVFSIGSELLTSEQISLKFGVNINTFRVRLYRGMTAEQAALSGKMSQKARGEHV